MYNEHRGHFGSSHSLFERAHGFFCVSSFPGFVLSQLIAYSLVFVVFHVAPMSLLHGDDATSKLVPVSPVPAYSSNWTLLAVPLLTSTEWAPAPAVLWMKIH